jgi:hypothetical protein
MHLTATVEVQVLPYRNFIIASSALLDAGAQACVTAQLYTYAFDLTVLHIAHRMLLEICQFKCFTSATACINVSNFGTLKKSRVESTSGVQVMQEFQDCPRFHCPLCAYVTSYDAARHCRVVLQRLYIMSVSAVNTSTTASDNNFC